jgi:hypothetical protein
MRLERISCQQIGQLTADGIHPLGKFRREFSFESCPDFLSLHSLFDLIAAQVTGRFHRESRIPVLITGANRRIDFVCQLLIGPRRLASRVVMIQILKGFVARQAKTPDQNDRHLECLVVPVLSANGYRAFV